MKTQNGFSLVEGLLIILVVTVVGFAGWYAWDRSNNNKNDTLQPKTQEQPREHNKTSSETSLDNADQNSSEQRQEFSSYGITLSVVIPEGWTATGMNGYDPEYEYLIDITNSKRDIELSLQITKYEDRKYEQIILQEFTGFNGEAYYLTKGIDVDPVDNKYGQLGITKCNDGHCLTAIRDSYSLNANITPVGTNSEFNGSESNLNEVIKIFQSIKIN